MPSRRPEVTASGLLALCGAIGRTTANVYAAADFGVIYVPGIESAGRRTSAGGPMRPTIQEVTP
jgi:hypothetical protein